MQFAFHHNNYYNALILGNWDTLEVKPKARGLDTREELLKFYDENYSANLMHLVVYTNGNKYFVYSMSVELFFIFFELLQSNYLCMDIFRKP